MRIGIVGLGYVGLTLGIAACDSGIEVCGVEINQKIMKCLSEKKAHFYEPGLDELINKYYGTKFFPENNFPQDKKYDAFVITVGTPLKSGSKEPDFDYIRQALDTVLKVYTGHELVILRSTVSAGTTRNIALKYLAQQSGISEDSVLVSFCPERTVEGKALLELHTLPQVVSGNSDKAIWMAVDLFRMITDTVIVADSLEEAELVKLYCNTYRDMTFAIGNAFCMAAQTYGVNGTNVIKKANEGYDRSRIALPGFVAGPCLEKDAYILTNNMPDCSEKDFILKARKYNESLGNKVISCVESYGLRPDKCCILVSGLAFKGVPATSDLRGSDAVRIAQKLYSEGYTLMLHDFVADPKEVEDLGVGSCVPDFYGAAAFSDVILILNNHKKYGELMVMPCLKNKLIIDAWGACSNLYDYEDVNIVSLGNMMMHGEVIS